MTPHFGGLWETAIKSVKRNFSRTEGTTKIFFENCTTLITQIKAIFNSRPLTASSSDANYPSTLTPAHFLIGRPLTAWPEPSQEDIWTLNRRLKSINNIVRQIVEQKVVRGLLDNTSTSTKIAQKKTSNSTPSMTLLSSRKTTRLQCYGHWQGLQKFLTEITRQYELSKLELKRDSTYDQKADLFH